MDDYYYNSYDISSDNSRSEFMEYYDNDDDMGVVSSYSFMVCIKNRMYIIYTLFILFPIMLLYWF